MTSIQLFREFTEIDPALLETIETQAFEDNRETTRRKLRRPLLIAALIATMLLLIGCAVVYVLKMETVKIAAGSAQREYSLVDGTYVKDPHTVSTVTFALAGLKGSNTYQACGDFYAFQSEYIANGEKMAEDGTISENYWEAYEDAMQEKALALAKQYGLKPEGQPLDFRTTRNLCNALGVERFTRNGSEICSSVNYGQCYDTGNFWLEMNFTFPEGEGYAVLNTPGILRWNRRDCFSRDYVTIVESGDWVERNYTTASGSNVLILQSPSQELGYILCDRGDAVMSLQLCVNVELLSEEGGVVSAEYRHMTDKQIEMVADAIDFAVQPRIPTQADVEAQAGISQEVTQNGYTLQVKSVTTDGYVAQILIGVTAPEGTVLPTAGALGFANSELLPTDGSIQNINRHKITVDDGDGKDNTADLLMIYDQSMSQDAPAFATGTTWNLYMVDILHSDWNADTGMIRDTLAEGEWLFPIPFDGGNGDYREIEILSEPISAKASIGWAADGTDCLETFRITSVILRSQSIRLTSNAEGYADFFGFNGASSYVVMKDGSSVKIMNQRFTEPIDLEQVDYVLLADGTKIMAPEAFFTS